jgi:hypothetical protein
LVSKNTKKKKKNQNLQKNKKVEGPMCFRDQATLPINRGHNTHTHTHTHTHQKGQFRDKTFLGQTQKTLNLSSHLF